MYATMTLLIKNDALTFEKIKEGIEKIRVKPNHRFENIVSKLKSEVDTIKSIIKHFDAHEALESMGRIKERASTLDNLLLDLNKYDNKYDEVKINDLIGLIIAANEAIKQYVASVTFEERVYNEVFNALASSQALEHGTSVAINKLLKLSSKQVLNDLARKLYICSDLRNVLMGDNLVLWGYINQFKLNERLNKLGYDVSVAPYKRVIITTVDVLEGLDLIINYLNRNEKSIDDIFACLVSADMIANDLKSDKISSGFEIAWGLLDQLLKRKLKSEPVFVTTSFVCAGEVITSLDKNSTLVLDGHGGATSCAFADKPSLMAADLLLELEELLEKDSDRHIDHLLLQSCNSGTLKQAGTVSLLMPKQNLDIGKGRMMVLGGTDVTADDLFEKPQGLSSLAAGVYNALLKNGRLDMAFTFSEDLLCPSVSMGRGNRGVRKVAYGEAYTPWPENVLRSQGECESTLFHKSTTIVLLPDHRKAGEAGAFFKQLKLTPENLRHLGVIRGAGRLGFFDGSVTTEESPSSSPVDGRMTPPPSGPLQEIKDQTPPRNPDVVVPLQIMGLPSPRSFNAGRLFASIADEEGWSALPPFSHTTGSGFYYNGSRNSDH